MSCATYPRFCPQSATVSNTSSTMCPSRRARADGTDVSFHTQRHRACQRELRRRNNPERRGRGGPGSPPTSSWRGSPDQRPAAWLCPSGPAGCGADPSRSARGPNPQDPGAKSYPARDTALAHRAARAGNRYRGWAAGGTALALPPTVTGLQARPWRLEPSRHDRQAGGGPADITPVTHRRDGTVGHLPRRCRTRRGRDLADGALIAGSLAALSTPIRRAGNAEDRGRPCQDAILATQELTAQTRRMAHALDPHHGPHADIPAADIPTATDNHHRCRVHLRDTLRSTYPTMGSCSREPHQGPKQPASHPDRTARG